MCLRIIDPQIFFPDLQGHGIHFSLGHFVLGVLHQINNIPCPAAKIDVSGCIMIIISNTQRPKHMGKLHRLAVWNCELSNSAESSGICSIGCILLCNIAHKGCILRTSQNSPTVGVILFNTCADVIDDQSCGIFTTTFCIRIGIPL